MNSINLHGDRYGRVRWGPPGKLGHCSASYWFYNVKQNLSPRIHRCPFSHINFQIIYFCMSFNSVCCYHTNAEYDIVENNWINTVMLHQASLAQGRDAGQWAALLHILILCCPQPSPHPPLQTLPFATRPYPWPPSPSLQQTYLLDWNRPKSAARGM